MKNSFNKHDHLNEGADKLRHSSGDQQQPEGVTAKEKLTHDAHQERGAEKARKDFEHADTTESIKSELDHIKDSHKKTRAIDPAHHTTQRIRTRNLSKNVTLYPTASQGREASVHKVTREVSAMQSFFGRKKAA